jgi:hypothetical protein
MVWQRCLWPAVLSRRSAQAVYQLPPDAVGNSPLRRGSLCPCGAARSELRRGTSAPQPHATVGSRSQHRQRTFMRLKLGRPHFSVASGGLARRLAVGMPAARSQDGQWRVGMKVTPSAGAGGTPFTTRRPASFCGGMRTDHHIGGCCPECCRGGGVWQRFAETVSFR